MLVGIPVYQGVNLLDVAGPMEIFYWAGQSNDLSTILISEDGQPVTSINDVKFDVQASFADAPKLDILWVPGGAVQALEEIMKDVEAPYLNYLRKVETDAAWICSVCEGAMLLARAGLLDGHNAATHWAFVDCLRRFPDVTVPDGNPRFLVSDNRLTGGGVSSGLDESLELIRRLFGKEAAKRVQVTIEYFPKPPVQGQLPGKGPVCRMNWEKQSRLED